MIDGKEVREWSRTAYTIGYRFKPIVVHKSVGSFFQTFFLSAGWMIWVLCFAFALGLMGIGFMFNNTKLSKAFRSNTGKRGWRYFFSPNYWSWKLRVERFYNTFIDEVSCRWIQATMEMWGGETGSWDEKIEILDKLIVEIEGGDSREGGRSSGNTEQGEESPRSTEKLTSMEKIVLAGLKAHRKNFGRVEASAEIDRAVENVAAAERDALEGRALNTLWAIGGICPLLGLFGTVIGIQGSFGSLTESLREGFDIVQTLPGLSKGINIALLTTIWGLAFGIPLLVAYYFFRAKVDWIYAKWQKVIVDITNEL